MAKFHIAHLIQLFFFNKSGLKKFSYLKNKRRSIDKSKKFAMQILKKFHDSYKLIVINNNNLPNL